MSRQPRASKAAKPVTVRAVTAERAHWKRAARAEGCPTLSAWIIKTLNEREHQVQPIRVTWLESDEMKREAARRKRSYDENNNEPDWERHRIARLHHGSDADHGVAKADSEVYPGLSATKQARGLLVSAQVVSDGSDGRWFGLIMLDDGTFTSKPIDQLHVLLAK